MISFEKIKKKLEENVAKKPWLFSLAILIFILISAGMGWIIMMRTELRRMEDEIRKRGEPVTHDELNAFYASVPDDLNAALTYKDAWENFVPISATAPEYKLVPVIGESYIPNPKIELTPEDIAASKAYLEKNKKSLELIMKAAKMEKCRFPIDYREGWGMKVEHLQGMRVVLDIMVLKACIEIEEENIATALELLDTLSKIRRHICAEPDSSAYFGGNIFYCYIFRLSERLLNSRVLSNEELDRLEKIMQASPDATKAFRFAFQGERARIYGGDDVNILKHTFTYYISYLGGGSETRTISDGRAKLLAFSFFISGLVYPIRINILTISKQVIEFGTSKYDRKKINDFENMRNQRRYNPAWWPAYRSVNWSFGYFYAPQRIEMEKAVTLLAISARRFEAKNTRLPNELEELVPNFIAVLPQDAFGHGPLKFRSGRIEIERKTLMEGGKQKQVPIYRDGIMIYSVGQDGLDNAGGESNRDGVGRHSDISVMLFPHHEKNAVSNDDTMTHDKKK